MPLPKLSLIVARAENGVIGMNNQLPWRLSNDLQYFKRVTMGKPIIMGRKTYESIGRPLPGRTNIVVTRNPEWRADNVVVVHSLSQALEAVHDADEVMLIGGAELYQQGLGLASTVYLTEVKASPEGDAYFSELSEEWEEVSRQPQEADEKNQFEHDFVVYKRSTV
ncbi:dihydrofolate reductase [Hahella sp. CCB-MM4]|uniref:dihydrofolate reductase n=1 Tax=Hahella sp. (strain CCB-MM4) TaxID=1926491 RepID=UPI000B9AD414|nr:dihydrofolate reductase [Hahella sp. CCB-MM4]OZG72032.1 dihydrofolate reductase [Hahella sp. CCB-MM4]